MKLILENWRRYLTEGIYPTIQTQLDVVLGKSAAAVGDLPLDDIAVQMVRHDPDSVEFRYVQVNKETGEVDYHQQARILRTGPKGLRLKEKLAAYPRGYIEIARADKDVENYGPCLKGWVVVVSSVPPGLNQQRMGPLLYEIALEWASQEENGGGLASDRFGVSAPAEKVWTTYLSRAGEKASDIEARQLDTLDYPERRLTKKDPKDDCYQKKAMDVNWDNWDKTPYAKLYRKIGTPVIDALGEKFLQEGQDVVDVERREAEEADEPPPWEGDE